MKMRFMRGSLPLASLAFCTLAFSLTGCDCGTDPSEPAIRKPKAGSSFTYANYTKDSLGRRDDSSEEFTTRTIVNANATIAGKSGVVQFTEGTDTTSMYFESDGDVQLLQPALNFPNDEFPAPPGVPVPSINIPAQWAEFGFGSKAQSNISGIDTTVAIPLQDLPFPLSVTIKVSGTTKYIGQEDITVNNEKISTQKGVLTVNSSFVTLLGSVKTTTVDTLWFAPKLGMFIKDDGLTTAELPAQLGPSGTTGGTYSILTGYTLQP